MATITEVQLQDGSVHQLGGGTNVTYTLSKSGSTITLTGSGGDVSSVTDADTTYTFSLNGNTLTITPSTGSPQTITLPDDDTSYSLSISGHTVTLTGSDGSTSSVTIPDNNTTYGISISGHTITLTDSDGHTDSVTVPDNNTTYTISVSGNSLTLTPSTGTAQSVTLPDNDTTYTISASGDTITLTDSDGHSQTATVADDDTTYTISISGHTITLTPSTGLAQTITIPDDDTTYTLSISGDVLTLTGSDGETDSVTLPIKRNLWYGTSTTAAATAAKVVTTADGDFTLATGNMVRVKFTNANSYNGTATLNVDGTGAVNITRVGTTATTRYYWTAGEVVDFVYDGTNFVMSDKGTATTTYYGLTKLSSSTSSTSTALAATPSAVKAAYDLANSKQDELVSGTNIKTINGESVLGSGDIVTPDDDTTYTISYANNVLTLTGSDGSTSAVTIQGGGGGGGLFIAEYNVTPYADILAAYNDGQDIVCVVDYGGSVLFYPLTEYTVGVGFKFEQTIGFTTYTYSIIGATNQWSSNIVTDNPTATPTASRISRFDSSAHMNSTDMTAQEVSDFLDGLNATGIHADDYVVEQGTSGYWIYTKWNSGKLEQWYSGNPGSYTISTTRGQLRSGGWITYTYPIPFVDYYPSVTVTATITSDAYVVWAQAGGHTLTSIQVRIAASANISANSNYNIHIHAVGRWK